MRNAGAGDDILECGEAGWRGGMSRMRLFRALDEHPHYPAPHLIALRQP